MIFLLGNLLDSHSAAALLHNIGIGEYQIGTISFLGLPSNIYVHIRKSWEAS